MNDSLLREFAYLTETSHHRLNKNVESQSSVNSQLRTLHVVTKKNPTRFWKFLAHLLFRKTLSIYNLLRISKKVS